MTKAPTQETLSAGVAQSTPMKDGTPFYLWHKDLTCQFLDTLDGWNRQSQDDRNAQKWSGDYASYIKAALKADEQGEHHVIVDGYYDEAQNVAKRIKQCGADFVAKVNASLKEKDNNRTLTNIALLRCHCSHPVPASQPLLN